MNNVLWILLAAVLIVLVIGRRLMGEPLQARRVFILPLIVAIFGGYQLSHLHHVQPLDVGVLAAEAGLAITLGVVRGLTVQVFVRDGHLWQRYRPLTIVVWVVSIAVRLGATAGAYAIGADRSVLQAGLLLVLGLTLAGESAVVGMRSMRLGAPFAPRTPGRTRLSG
jgi:hypothetical protein